MNSIFLSSNDGLGMKERVVSITKLNPLLSRFLVPMHFFLEKNVVIVILKLLFQEDMVEGINSIKVLLNSFQPSFIKPFPLKNITKDLLIENNRMILNVTP